VCCVYYLVLTFILMGSSILRVVCPIWEEGGLPDDGSQEPKHVAKHR
jgi:hypothetical protein